MGKKSSPPPPPAPPPPKETAAAQTSTNIGTAIAQQALNNVNQVTPGGSLTYSQSGSHTYTDPGTGQTHVIPTYTATQTLSPENQRIQNKTEEAQLNFSTLAADQSARLKGLLGRPVDASTLPERGEAEAIRQTNLQRVGQGPVLQTELGEVGDVQRHIADAGPITRTYGTDFSKDRQRVEDALMARMSPRLEQDRQRLESRLASQGIRMGSDAYQSAMDDFSRQTNDARFGAILNAGQEQSRLTGLAASRANFENAAQAQAFKQNAANAQLNNSAQSQAFQQESERVGQRNDALQQMHRNRAQGIGMDNQTATQEVNADIARFDAMNNARNQALQERFALRNQPINEITALMSGSQVTQPSFITPQTAQLATTDTAGIQAGYDNAMNNRYARLMANRGQNMGLAGSLFGGLAGLGGAAIMASDKRVKKDIKRVGKTNDGQPIYTFRYKDSDGIQMGLMAQDVEKKTPEAVIERPDGIKMVNYDLALKGAK
ncbi:tail fiber domain-containing protein [Vibrio penaeicida]|uniref:tail fiber domain-containing protein n=1 Tax=Vibrio penaeicida TaxID=104609 RepID=UPI0027339C09|nr:tail fiber domain-containing protein [Vibrio penaeicida]MDP2575388.1 tail fiber domain-containing protein [Vibrio penaeicida]